MAMVWNTITRLWQPVALTRPAGLSVTPGQNLPGVAAGAQAGGSPPAPVLQNGSSEDDCTTGATFGTGSAPAVGAMVAVTFAIPKATTSYLVVLTPNNALTAALGLFATGIGANGFTVSALNAPAAGQGNGTYNYSWAILVYP